MRRAHGGCPHGREPRGRGALFAIRMFGLDGALYARAQFGAADQYRDRQGAAGGPGKRCLFPHGPSHSGLQHPVHSKNQNK